MLSFPIHYDEPVFRPPSEGNSLIIQVSIGCSWNQCRFCEMYSTKQFKVRKQEEVCKDIEAFVPYAQHIRRVFLADGDPLVLSTEKLLPILDKIKNTFPRLTRISAYASPGNLNRKSLSELKELHTAGLDLVYVGIESGDNQVLKRINKGETFETTLRALQKSKEANINSSVMIINGLGGKELSEQHALNSAKLLNESQVKYLSTLVLTHYKGIQHFQNRLQSDFIPLNQKELFVELQLFIQNLTLHETIFRSDHASNSLILKGVLGRDKAAFLQKLDTAIRS